MLNTAAQQAPRLFSFPIIPQSDVLDAPYLRAIASFADKRGPALFTPGGGVLLDTPLNATDRQSLPQPQDIKARFLDLPKDRYLSSFKANSDFATFVERYTIAHAHAGYALVVIPLSGRLSGEQIRAIADAAEHFGHGNIRLTADVSIRLPNVPKALLRPVYEILKQAGLLVSQRQNLAAA